MHVGFTSDGGCEAVSLVVAGAMPHSLVALGFVAAGKVRGEADADRPFPFTEGVFP